MQGYKIEDLDRFAWEMNIPDDLDDGAERTYTVELALVYAEFASGRIPKEKAEIKKRRLRAKLEQAEKDRQFYHQLNIKECEHKKWAEIYKARILRSSSAAEMTENALCCVRDLTEDEAWHTAAVRRREELKANQNKNHERKLLE